MRQFAQFPNGTALYNQYLTQAAIDRYLILQGRPEGIDAAPAQILVEVLAPWRHRNRFDPDARGSGDQAVSRAVPSRITIAKDIEPA